MTSIPSPPTEEALAFACEGEHLLGVLCRPPGEPIRKSAGVLIVVGGPQYRAGSHRQFVHWARALAAAGAPTLRFDVRGMGDSTGGLRSFTELSADIGAAIDALERACPQLSRFLLCGLCDGASAALLYFYERKDPRVAGLMLLNPWVRSEQTLARTYVKHYYLQRLVDRRFWAKLLRGQVAVRALRELGDNLRQARQARRDAAQGAAASELPYTQKMAAALAGLRGPVLLALSGNDYTAKEFLEHCTSDATWARALQRHGVQRLDLPNADHTFSTTADRLTLEQACVTWLANEQFVGALRSGVSL